MTWQLHHGAGAPGTIPGQTDGDNYINTDTGGMYQLVGTTWILRAIFPGLYTTPPGDAAKFWRGDASWAVPPGGSGGDVTGPASATDDNFASFNGATGKIIKDSGHKPADFAVSAKGVTNGDSHDHVGGDGATITSAAISLTWETSKSYVSGNIVVRGRSIYICVSDHTSGTFYVDWLTNAYWTCMGMGPGSIKAADRATAEPGWLLLDNKTIGDASSGADYAGDAYRELYEYINDGTYVWTNHTTITLIDSRGVFLKGAGTTNRAAGIDASGNAYAGTFRAYAQDKMQGHYHHMAGTASQDGMSSNGTWTDFFMRDGYNNGTYSDDDDCRNPVTDGTNGTPRTGHTTEPQSVGVTMMIKY